MYSYTNNRVEIETVKKLTNISENYDVNILADNFLSKNKKQIASWNLDDLKNKIYKINEIEQFVKNNSTNSVNIISDFILNY